MLFGYMRVSTADQNLASQRDILTQAGCARLFGEKASGADRERAELEKLLGHVRSGDLVVVTRLDRLARSTVDLLTIVERLTVLGVGLRSLAEPWADTTSPAGAMLLTVFAGIAQFERSLIMERTSAGRDRAKAAGVRFGRREILTAEQVAHADEMLAMGMTKSAVARTLQCHRVTLHRAFVRREASARASGATEAKAKD